MNSLLKYQNMTPEQEKKEGGAIIRGDKRWIAGLGSRDGRSLSWALERPAIWRCLLPRVGVHVRQASFGVYQLSDIFWQITLSKTFDIVQGDKCTLGLHFVDFIWMSRNLPDLGRAAVSMADLAYQLGSIAELQNRSPQNEVPKYTYHPVEVCVKPLIGKSYV